MPQKKVNYGRIGIDKLGLSCAKLRLSFAKLWLRLIIFTKGSSQNNKLETPT